MATRIDATALQARLSENGGVTLVDVLPEEYFAAQHLPGARRACVYEVDFLEQINQLGVSPSDELILYGAGDGSLDSAVAAEKLEGAGFTNVIVFNGGRAEWKNVGGALEGDPMLAPAVVQPENRPYLIDSDKSTVEWVGRSLTSTHRGLVSIAKGELTLHNGQLASGHIELDMRSISNTDIEDASMREVLNAHLKSDDFFDVEHFPTATLTLHSASPLAGATPGSPNFDLAADLTIKGITHPIEFPAIIAVGSDKTLTAVAQVEIDRTRWNVLYGSGRFFKMLGKHLVNDAIDLLVKIVAR